MKIVIAHYKYMVQGGPERYLLKFTKLAEENGHQVIPFSINYVDNMPTEYSRYFVSTYAKSSNFDGKNSGIKYYLQGIRREFHNYEAYEKLLELIDVEKPDLIYTLIPGELTPDIFKAAKKRGVPVILRISDFRLLCGSYSLIRGNDICEECINGRYFNCVKYRCIRNSFLLSLLRSFSLTYIRKRKSYNLVDAVITPPKNTANLFIRSGYFPKEKIFVNPTFIDCKAYIPNYTHDGYVLCLGRFTKEKGFIYVVEALKYLKDINVKVAVTGEKDNCDEDLKRIIDEYDLDSQVEFVGFLQGKQLELLTSNAMCIACPAIWYENLPNVIIEAFAYGKPVIASRIGSLADAVSDGETGLLFEPKNSQEIASCIRKLYTNNALCEKLGKNARIVAETKYSPETHWNKFIEIYNKISNKQMEEKR